MKKRYVLTFLIFGLFLHVNTLSVKAQQYDRMLYDNDSSMSGGNTIPIAEQVKKIKDKITKDTFNTIFYNPNNTEPINQDTVPTEIAPTNSVNPIIPPLQADPGDLLADANLVYPETILADVRKCLVNRQVYEAAAAQTGMPWYILAGIHYTEGGCGTDRSLVSGRVLGTNEPDLAGECSSQKTGLGVPKALGGGNCGFDNLLDTAVYAGNHLKITNGGNVPKTHQELVKMVSNYNGGGNSNCRGGTPYSFCPPLFERDDDTYVNNKKPSADGRYDVMYIRYCADRKTCKELGKPNPVHQLYGVLTVAGALQKL